MKRSALGVMRSSSRSHETEHRLGGLGRVAFLVIIRFSVKLPQAKAWPRAVRGSYISK